MTVLRVRVPATSANLGPGFDTLGLALAHADELTVATREAPGATVRVSGVGEGVVPTDEGNLVVRATAHVYERLGRRMPGLDIEAHNRIPHGRGMGSSGAAIGGGGVVAGGAPPGRPPPPPAAAPGARGARRWGGG